MIYDAPRPRRQPIEKPDRSRRPASLVHLGYRQAVESLTIDVTPANLRSILAAIPKDEFDLYVTGHSLGAAAAQLFSAWVKAGGVPEKKINVKCYSFGTPHSANLPMSSNYGLALANDGFSYRVDNSLDTAPQLPPAKVVTTDLINPAIASDLSSKATPTGIYAASPLAPLIEKIKQATTIPFPFSIVCELVQNLTAQKPSQGAQTPPMSMAFVGMGTPHIIAAQPPVVYNGRYYPQEFFPNLEVDQMVEIPDDTTRQWWQHWPYSYAHYLMDEIEEE